MGTVDGVAPAPPGRRVATDISTATAMVGRMSRRLRARMGIFLRPGYGTRIQGTASLRPPYSEEALIPTDPGSRAVHRGGAGGSFARRATASSRVLSFLQKTKRTFV